MSRTITVPTQMWYQRGELRLDFPDSWEVVSCTMQGHDAARLTPQQIETALAQPVGSPSLRELARGRKEAVIVFDDNSRPTRTAELVPHVLAELQAGGISEDAVSFVCALGSHGAHTYEDFCKKLGKETVDRFPVYNHNPYENCQYVGRTSQGTELSVNAEVMRCDLKVGIGSVVPHVQTGFGGGGKIVLPGIASIDSIEGFHRIEFKAREAGRGDTIGPGRHADNPMLRDFNEAARMIGLDFKIDTIINGACEPCALFAGENEAEFGEALKTAVPHYATRMVPDVDVAVVNNYGKGNEAIVGLLLGIPLLMEKSGDLVLVMDCPAGQVVHYLLGSFGRSMGGRLFRPLTFQLPWLKRLIVLSPQIERSFTDWLAIPDTIWVETWAEALDILTRDYPGGARAAVVHDATIQYLV